MALFRNTYRVETARLQGYDYAAAGWYHVVICTKDRVCVFGEVREGAMCLSAVGKMAAVAWWETLKRYERALPDAFMVMPNHVHALVGLLPEPGPISGDVTADLASDRNPGRGSETNSVEMRRGASLQGRGASRMGGGETVLPNAFGPLRSGSLSSIVNHYKGRVTRHVRRTPCGIDLVWQPRFWDRVVRSERELEATRRYILENPLRWQVAPQQP